MIKEKRATLKFIHALLSGFYSMFCLQSLFKFFTTFRERERERGREGKKTTTNKGNENVKTAKKT